MDRLVTEPGSVLAAAPDMLDPNFMHSVVLMCRHSEEGAFGFVINTLVTTPGPSLKGIAIVASGVPVYYVWKWKAQARL